MMQHGTSAEEAVSQVVTMARFLENERARLGRALADVAPEDPGDEEPEAQLHKIRVDPDMIVPRDSASDEVVVPSGTFVVSVKPRSGFRRLHRVGDCPMKPGLDYFTFEVLGDAMPEPSKYNARCGRCWREARGNSSGQEADSASSSGSSSDSSA